jgi:trk system potassium uptake protein TrkH|tara:strand:+ start:77 stop:1561 length:1485 start_codon:yes stop_codon:yes gene_type:complete
MNNFRIKNEDGNKIHRVQRSSEHKTEIIKLERRSRSRKAVNSPLFLFYGLIFFIFIGAIGLFLPFSSNSNQNISLVDSFFISTSAVTVTGLTPVDSGVVWNVYGLTIISILSFIGGLGFMVGAGFLIYILFGKKINLEQKMLINESLSDSSTSKYASGSSIKLVLNIFYLTILIQIIGVFLIYFVGDAKNIDNNHNSFFNSIFHSISSFNGSGFDIMRDHNGGSIGSVNSNINLLYITSILVFIGSIGYPFILEFILNSKLFFQSKFKKIFFSLNFKVVFFTTLFMIFFGTFQFLLAEWSNTNTLGKENFDNKIIFSFFHSFNRTSGFSLFDYNLIHNSTSITTMILMFVGGGSLSVSGGIKVGTLTVIFAALISNILGKDEITIFKRSISREVTRRALIIFIFSIMIIIFSFMIISSFEPDTIFRELLFECVSAFANVGLTTGITSKLNDFSKIFLIFLMIVGRFGPLLLALMFIGKNFRVSSKPAYENIRLG